MNLINCEHPKYVVDKISGEHRLVPCGKCDTCRGARSALWVERINAEMSVHPYNLFVTLTYNDDFVPRLYRSDNWLVDDESGFGLSLDDYDFDSWPDKEKKFVNEAPYFNYIRVSDFQKFVKRLRRCIDNLNIPEDENSKIRYFACAEYGETYLRPHFHILFFVDSKTVFENFKQMLSTSWSIDAKPIGNYKCECISSSAPSYVAKYLNSTSHLPKIFQLRPITQKSFCSKTPFIGFGSFSDEQIEEIVYSSTPRIVGERRNTNGLKEKVAVPLWRSLEDFLWPKFSGYCRIPNTLRIELYKIYERFPYPLKKFLEEVYFASQFAENSDCMHWIWKHFNDDGFGYDEDLNPIGNSHSVESLYYASRRVVKRASQFGVSVDYYIRHLLEFHNCSKPYANNVDWFSYLEDLTLSDSYVTPYLVDIDPILFDKVRSLPYDVAKLRYGLLIESFGLDFEHYYYYYGTSASRYRSVYDLPFVQAKIDLTYSIALKSRKTKRKNEYMMFRNMEHQDRRYYDNINNYYAKGRK